MNNAYCILYSIHQALVINCLADATIYVDVGPYLGRGIDSFGMDYSIVRLPASDSKVADVNAVNGTFSIYFKEQPETGAAHDGDGR